MTVCVGVQQNLHVVLIMDCTNENFTINCESNPALYRKCSVQWLERWRDSSMKKVEKQNFSLYKCKSAVSWLVI